ncbi:MAG: cyclophilin-like fold protein [Candidatus Bathyarchaeota archaeon]|nr:cyclophilin-like fold protein [Candidatus Bathyarchaeota archaeon]
MKKIKIISRAIGEVVAELFEERSPQTVKALWAVLPITARANTWGNEIYFSIGIKIARENANEVVEKGALAYWPPGEAFCIFFGPTPASRGNEIRAASPVNIFGKISGDPEIFKKVRHGDEIVVNKTE